MLLILLACYGIRRDFLLISLLHSANMAPTFHIPIAYGPLWSLGVEEQFYLCWPLVVWIVRPRWLSGVAAFIFVESILLQMSLTIGGPKATMPIWHSAHGLALGALLAVFLRSRFGSRRNVSIFAAGLLAIGAGMAIASGWRWARPQLPGMLQSAGSDLCCAAVLLGAMLLATSRFERWMRPRWLLFFGEISYGLYLVHMLAWMAYRRVFHPGDDLRPLLVQFVICAPIAIGLAPLSRFTIEDWFLGLKDKPLFRRKESRAFELVGVGEDG